MWTYRRLNREKEEQCAREGIDESMKDRYRDLADKSPLFRWVPPSAFRPRADRQVIVMSSKGLFVW